MGFQALPGFRDFEPEAMALRRWVESSWHQASRRAGFQEWDGPPLESLELFTSKSGPEIAEQLYAFTDKGGREVTLRGEMTPTLARLLAARANALPKPIKWYCVPQFFRYERQQRGRLREFYQWNVDVVGAEDVAADAEVIAVALDALRILGLGPEDVVLRLSDRRLLRRMLRSIDVGPDEEGDVMACIDRLERDAAAATRLEERLGPTRAGQLLGWCQDLPVAEMEEIAPVLEACRDFGVAEYVQPDLRIVRGLAYYTGVVWEIFDREGKLRSVAGGGALRRSRRGVRGARPPRDRLRHGRRGSPGATAGEGEGAAPSAASRDLRRADRGRDAGSGAPGAPSPSRAGVGCRRTLHSVARGSSAQGR